MSFLSKISLLLFVCSALPYSGHSQTKLDHNIGDRVQASPLSMPDERFWRNCTVTAKVRNAYTLRCDPMVAGGPTENFTVQDKWVRASSSVAAAEQPTSPQNKPSGPVACFEPEADDEKRHEKDLRTAIRRLFEKEPAPGMDGRVTLAFHSFEVGPARKFRLYVDGPDADISKPVYPVRTTFTTCTDYRTRIYKVKRERAFSCYTDKQGRLQCGQVALARKTEDVSESIPK